MRLHRFSLAGWFKKDVVIEAAHSPRQGFCDGASRCYLVGSVCTSRLVQPASLLLNISEVFLHPSGLKAGAACGAPRSISRVVFDAIDWQEGPNLFHLFLFDSVNPGRLDGLSMMHAVLVRTDEFLRKVWFHLRSMTRLEFGELRAYFLERLWNFWHTLTRRTWAARVGTKVFSPGLRSELPNMYFVGQRYRPKPYTGRVLLFRRGLRPISRYLDWRLGWGGVLSGPIDVVEIEGGHSNMFDEPGVRRTAAALAASLQGHAQDENRQPIRNGVGARIDRRGRTGPVLPRNPKQA